VWCTNTNYSVHGHISYTTATRTRLGVMTGNLFCFNSLNNTVRPHTFRDCIRVNSLLTNSGHVLIQGSVPYNILHTPTAHQTSTLRSRKGPSQTARVLLVHLSLLFQPFMFLLNVHPSSPEETQIFILQFCPALKLSLRTFQIF
jgi:hypothetical protein